MKKYTMMIEHSWAVAECGKYCNIMCIFGTFPSDRECTHIIRIPVMRTSDTVGK